MQIRPSSLGATRWMPILALLALGFGVIALAATIVPPSEQEIIPSDKDFDDDAVLDAIVGDPTENSTPGVVEIRSGLSNDLIVRLQGRSANDRFGHAAVVLGDVSGDGIDDIIVGAPRDGEGHAFIFYGPFPIECPLVIDADNANVVLTGMPDEFEFGFAVAPLYDIDNDQIPEIRVAAKVLGTQGELLYRTSVFSGWTGNLIATVTGTGPFVALHSIAGDTDYDADVDQHDLDRVIENLGRTGQLTRYDGDVNDDAVVDFQDVALVTSRMGVRAYDVGTGSSPCSSSLNCFTIFPEPSTEYCLCEVEPDDGVVVAVIEMAGMAAVITPNPGTPCSNQLTACLNDPRVIAALQLIDARCYGPGGGAPSTLTQIYCKVCPPNYSPSGLVEASCGLFGRKLKVTICHNATDFCATLAHELTHVSQTCDAGLFSNCNNYKRWAKNQYHRMCAEIEAMQLAQQCWDVASCCDLACQAVPGWKNCPLSCYACCVQGSGACCSNGRNTCVDNGADPCATTP